MPDALELPGVRRAVVPLVRAGDAVVDELVAHRLPRLAAVVGALDHLPEPAAGLRRIQPVRVGGRALEVVDLPAGKVGAADVPPLALAVRRQDERALARPNQYPYSAHRYSCRPVVCRPVVCRPVATQPTLRRPKDGKLIAKGTAPAARAPRELPQRKGRTAAAQRMVAVVLARRAGSCRHQPRVPRARSLTAAAPWRRLRWCCRPTCEAAVIAPANDRAASRTRPPVAAG